MTPETAALLREWANTYNDPKYFTEDPISFPRLFHGKYLLGECTLQDVEVAAVFAAHFAWGRREMIVRDCNRLFEHMNWQPYRYVMEGEYLDNEHSIHRTIKWCEVARICRGLRSWYESDASRALTGESSLEGLDVQGMRRLIFSQKEDPKAPCKKIHMMRRWMVRNDGKVDIGIWKHTSPSSLLIPLDVHVYDVALALGLTSRKSKDITTVREITDSFADIFPGDPCKGDFALFGYGVTHPKMK